MNFQAFVQIVDQLGGVEMTVDKHYVYDDPSQDLHINIPAGAQKMDGKTAPMMPRATGSPTARNGAR